LTGGQSGGLSSNGQGFQNKEIPEKLKYRLKTVETHRLKAREKVGLGAAAQCRQYAEEQGWL
jgi:DNA-binding NarL/FixJ family response regulator